MCHLNSSAPSGDADEGTCSAFELTSCENEAACSSASFAASAAKCYSVDSDGIAAIVEDNGTTGSCYATVTEGDACAVPVPGSVDLFNIAACDDGFEW